VDYLAFAASTPQPPRQTKPIHRQRQGVATLVEIADARRTAIMFAESDFRRCRRRLRGDYLVAKDVTVQHILSGGELEPHVPTPGTKIMDGKVTYPGQPTLFDI
jgi:uncharacterized protein (DUF488 family)